MLLTLIVGLIVVGVLLWALKAIPMDATIQRVLHTVIIVAVVLWVLQLVLPSLRVWVR